MSKNSPFDVDFGNNVCNIVTQLLRCGPIPSPADAIMTPSAETAKVEAWHFSLFPICINRFIEANKDGRSFSNCSSSSVSANCSTQYNPEKS